MPKGRNLLQNRHSTFRRLLFFALRFMIEADERMISMDNVRFGAFVAQLRKEQNMTQKDLADRLGVTDKAVSKWETGKGFPDVKLLEPLAQALGISLVELIRSERQQVDHLTVQEADALVSQAMDQSERTTARRYLRLLKWLLVTIGIMAAYLPVITLIALAMVWYWTNISSIDTTVGIIGGADGPTSIMISTAPTAMPPWFWPIVLGLAAAVCLVLAFRVWKLEKKLK